MITPKQERFVEELIKGKSQRQAYMAAYNADKMNLNTIDRKASLLLKDGEVRARYEELRAQAEEKTGDDASSMRARIIQEFRTLAFADIASFYEFHEAEEGTWITLKNLKEVPSAAIQELSFDSRGNPRVRLFDKQKALEKLAELYRIEAQVQDGNGVHVVFEEEDAEEYTT